MAKNHFAWLDFLVYLVARLLVCTVQALSLNTARTFATGLARLVYHCDRRHRLVAMENLRLAFPGRYNESELDLLVRSVYRHFCTLLIEIMHLPRKMHPTTWRQYFELDRDRGRVLVDCLLSGRPVMLVTGHFGNWEMGGFALGLFGFKGYAIARPLDNRYLDQYMRRFRESTGQKVLAKQGDFEQTQNVLSQGGVLATLADQDAGRRGLFVDFFGRPASTHKAVALLALEHRVPLVVFGAAKRGEPMRYQAVIADVIVPENYSGQPDALRCITQRFTSALEAMIRSAPEQYFWLHRRWKHEPAKPHRKAAGAVFWPIM